MTHMYSLSDDVLRGASINVNNPQIYIGQVGTTGSSFVTHIHYGAYFTLKTLSSQGIDIEHLEVPCSPLVFLADK